MKNFNITILFFIVLFLLFSCSEPAENNSYNSKDLKKDPVLKDVSYSKEFTTPGNYFWVVPGNIKGNITVTIIAGGGGGGGSGYTPEMLFFGGGGGGAGQMLIDIGNIEVTKDEIILVTVGNGGSGAIYYGNIGGDGENSSITTANASYVAVAGSGGNLGYNVYKGGAGYPSGQDSSIFIGGNGGNNGRGFGQGGEGESIPALSAPVNSGGGGGGSGSGRGNDMYPAGNGGSGYARIDYTVLE